MARFAIYEKGGDQRILREGSNKYAFVFTSFWLIAKGLWLEALAVFAFICFVALPLLPASPPAGLALSVLPAIYLWLEGQSMVAARLQRRGWVVKALVEAASEEGALMLHELHSSTATTPPPLPNAARPKVQGNLRGPSPFGLEGL
ncbi:MAG: DUF2628 domain-containing protein [Pseudomonadota bacterium]